MDKREFIQEKTEELLRKLGFETTQVVVEEEDGKYAVNLKTDEDAPALIGKYGETLSALQRICEVVFFKHFG